MKTSDKIKIALKNTVITLIILMLIILTLTFLSNAFIFGLSILFGSENTVFFVNRIAFIGVIIHELSHALFVTIFGGKVTKIVGFTLHGGSELGHIEYINRGPLILRALQNMFGGIAPIIVGTILLVILYNILKNRNIKSVAIKIIIYYLMLNIVVNMRLSSVDMINALTGVPILAVILLIIYMFVNIDITKEIFNKN